MPKLARLYLLLSAIISGGFIALLGATFSVSVEPEQFTVASVAIWFVAGTIVAAPLWIPALIPARFPTTLKVSRLVGAIVLLLPTCLFGSIVVHNVSRALSGLGATTSALVQGVILTSVCASCVLVLVWPELKRCASRNTERPL